MANFGAEFTTATLVYGVAPANGVQAELNTSSYDPKTSRFKGNYGTEERSGIVVENIRGKEDTVSLDKTGFGFYKHKTKLLAKEFADDDTVRNEYYPESVELIKKLTGASRVQIFDHTIRRRTGEDETGENKRQPVANVHVDQTTPASIHRVHRHMPAEDVPKLLEKRFQIINLWRPIENAADDWPLALCDYNSVNQEKDLFTVKLVFPERVGETFGVNYNPDHKWKYLRGMTPEEFVLIKCFDSVQDGSVAVFTPHTGFKDPATPENAPPRQSIELRALVFYD